MSRCRRLVLLLFGIGASVIFGLQTLGLHRWTFTPSRLKAEETEMEKSFARNVVILNVLDEQEQNQTFAPGRERNQHKKTNQSSFALDHGGVPEPAVVQLTPESSRPDPVWSASDPPSPMSAPDPPSPRSTVNLASTDPPRPVLNVAYAPDPTSSRSTPDVAPAPSGSNSLSHILAQKEQGKPRNDLKPPKSILSPEQLLQIMGSAIGGLSVHDPRKVTHVLVTTYFRSGSTFLGDILQQNWKTFYHFEPLHQMSNSNRIKESQVTESLSLLADLFRCNFTSPVSTKYLLWASEQRNTFLIHRNRFLWVACRMQPQLCFRPDFVNFVCVRAPWQVSKVTRLSVRQAGQLVLNHPDLDIRVLHLVRDPRGIISSRKVLEWCNTTSCADFRVLCNEMQKDFEDFQELRALRPERFFQVRYEDLSTNPLGVSKELLNSLGVPYTNTVGKFLRMNTKARAVDSANPYSTRRDSTRTPFLWRKKLKLDEIKRIQMGCASVLRNYGYHTVNSSQDLAANPEHLYSSDWTKT